MKSDDGKNREDIDQDQISSTDAMDEYFFDMLGSVADQQPLKQCEEEEGLSFHTDVERESFAKSHDLVRQVSTKMNPQAKAVSKTDFADSKPVFAEPERPKISPLIIPAAFPKLAPVVEEPKVNVKVEAKTESKTEVATKTKSQTKLDRNTALKILEKKRASLSSVQLARLEEKLGLKQKSRLKQKTATNVDVASKTTLAEELVTKAEAKPTQVEPVLEVKEKETIAKHSSTLQEDSNIAMIPGQPGHAGPPAWALDRFECLIFTVAGLKLAVPLVSLGAIYKIDHELTPIVGRADYFMGLFRHAERNVRVVDTAKWVMPDRWTEEARGGYHFVIRLGGNNWGLACDSVHESIQLETDMVKWRSERTTREWLSGTVIGHMCALLDADVLSSMLEQEATKQGSSFS
jgi:purine-binding chemotaxis protein CheW